MVEKPMARWRLVQLPFFLLALAATASFAQDGTGKAKNILRVETRLIEVNVVAQDSKGRAVKDLTRKDFTLFDNGKEVPIDIFAAESVKTASRAITTLPPNTYTNRLRGVPPSVTIILLDGLNTSFEDQTWARSEVIRFLENLQPQDRVAIFLLGDHLYILQKFTSDPKALLRVLESRKARIPSELESSTPPTTGEAASGGAGGPSGGATPSGGSNGTAVQNQQGLDAAQPVAPTAPSGGTRPSGSSIGAAAAQTEQAREEAIMEQFEEQARGFLHIDRVTRTLESFLEIAAFLKQFPGRKNLIWVSAGFPISIGFDAPRSPGDTRPQVHFGPEIERAFKALNDADIAVYPVDARGLVVGPSNYLYSTRGTMVELADHTGGRAFYNTNDLARVVRTALEDSQADYTLGFYPHTIRWDGMYHELKVKVIRPGVQLRYRKGYYAALDNSKNPEQANALIQRALNSPLDTTGLGLTVELEKDPEDPTEKVLLRIAMDAHDISFQSKDGSKTVELEMVFVQSGADGKVLRASRDDIDTRLSGDALNRLLNQGLRMRKLLDLVKGATLLQLVVRDSTSGNIGSVRIPLGG
jgi:VWFA-related protein